MKANWTAADMPNQTGRTAIVTGANVGIGYHTALGLARAGAHVVMACRDQGRATAAVDAIRQAVPKATLSIELIDVGSLASVRAFADRIATGHKTIDILINNAATMLVPQRRLTPDGFEMQVGINYLGHVALTGLLLTPLLAAGKSRVVSLSSSSIKFGGIDLNDLQSEKTYTPMNAYAKSKLALLMFAFELARRARGTGIVSVGAHPGWSVTTGQGLGSFTRFLTRVLAQPAAAGALPPLYAATESDVEPGSYYGPKNLGGMRGAPALERAVDVAYDEAMAARLFDTAERLTGVHFALPSRSAA